MKRILGIVLLFLLTGCQHEKPIDPEVDITKTTLLDNSIHKIEVYRLETHKEGPKVVIIGGIHGDEEAGFLAAEQLLESHDFFIGEVLLIPRANKVATELKQRYPGINKGGVYGEYKYSDLNRSLPGNEEGTMTEQIAFELVKLIKEFDPEYIIDLHESLRSYSSDRSRLGDSLIYSNGKSAWAALEILEIFNDTFLEEGDVVFRVDNSAPEGSFNNYFGSLDYVTLTTETNRELPLEKRVEQQLNLVRSFFQNIKNK